jgi:hypothetical protein
VEVVADGDPMDLGVAQATILRKKIQLSKAILEQLYGFRMLSRIMPADSVCNRMFLSPNG